jgi:D-alanine-D-alanine ligase
VKGAPLRVAVLAGGPSSEAEVSRVSARAVGGALGEAGHRAEVLELDANLPLALAAHPPDVVFPALHGPLGEDGCVQGLLEVLDLPYVGASVMASALAASKPDAKLHFRAAGLPLAADVLVRRGEDLVQVAVRVRERLGGAVVVKPASGGSAIGVSRVSSEMPDSALALAIEEALAHGDSVLVEQRIVGEEVTCGVLEDDDGTPIALPPTLIMAKSSDWYDFTSRYGTGGSEHRCPAPFDQPLIRRIQVAAVGAHRALGVRDLCRVDFVVSPDAAEPVIVLEVNTLPGMTATSLFPEAAARAGIGFAELCDRLVRRAAARPRRRVPEAVPMPG